MEKIYKIKLEDIPSYIKNEQGRIDKLETKIIAKLVKSIMNLYGNILCKKTEIEEYLREKTIIFEI